MPVSSSLDVYLELLERDQETSWLLGLCAFAVFEERRIEWMQHFADQNGKPPTDAEIQDWYKQQPNGSLLRAKGDAENALQVYAEQVEERMLEDERASIERDVIVSEIRSLRKPWADFGVNVAAGFLSALLFAAMLTILVAIAFVDASPLKLGKWMASKDKGTIENGQEANQ